MLSNSIKFNIKLKTWGLVYWDGGTTVHWDWDVNAQQHRCLESLEVYNMEAFFLNQCIPLFFSLSMIFHFSNLHPLGQYTQGCHLADKLENNACHDKSPIGCARSLCTSQPIKANEQ